MKEIKPKLHTLYDSVSMRCPERQIIITTTPKTRLVVAQALGWQWRVTAFLIWVMEMFQNQIVVWSHDSKCTKSVDVHT